MSALDKQLLIDDVSKRASTMLRASDVEILNRILLESLGAFDVEHIGTEADPVAMSKDYVQMFIDAKSIEGRSNSTMKRYIYVLNTFFNTENVKAIDVTTFHIRDYFMHEKRRGIMESTIEGYRCILSSFFGWLLNEGIITRNPCANIGAIKCRKEIRLPFSKEEIKLIEEHCSTDRDRALVAFLLSTGCRIGEVYALDIDDVDLRDMECKVLGKGNKERTVYIDDVTRMLLKRYLSKRTDNKPPLFINKFGERLGKDGIRYMLNEISRKSGVSNIHPHRFRRTLATNLINRGMPIQEVANVLGHDKIDTTMTYVYMNKRQVKNEYKRYTL